MRMRRICVALRIRGSLALSSWSFVSRTEVGFPSRLFGTPGGGLGRCSGNMSSLSAGASTSFGRPRSSFGSRGIRWLDNDSAGLVALLSDWLSGVCRWSVLERVPLKHLRDVHTDGAWTSLWARLPFAMEIDGLWSSLKLKDGQRHNQSPSKTNAFCRMSSLGEPGACSDLGAKITYTSRDALQPTAKATTGEFLTYLEDVKGK